MADDRGTDYSNRKLSEWVAGTIPHLKGADNLVFSLIEELQRCGFQEKDTINLLNKASDIKAWIKARLHTLEGHGQRALLRKPGKRGWVGDSGG